MADRNRADAMALWSGSAESNVPDTRGNLQQPHGSTGSDGAVQLGSGGGRCPARARACLLMQEARREVGRRALALRPRREEETARAMTLDRAPTAEMAIFAGLGGARDRREDQERGFGFGGCRPVSLCRSVACPQAKSAENSGFPFPLCSCRLPHRPDGSQPEAQSASLSGEIVPASTEVLNYGHHVNTGHRLVAWNCNHQWFNSQNSRLTMSENSS
ncbi:hypothetical protein BRADI_3g10170v3 [Brachypodium distachyon]|uniref:Uncharacterized protein n=1 Tax=Brachypodium distachyon TaxID=15368 RepID=A0A2K2CWC7_BRADI|nr:hypothetical protein BRADI_3g10170v3 [Brachypodium distachyon]